MESKTSYENLTFPPFWVGNKRCNISIECVVIWLHHKEFKLNGAYDETKINVELELVTKHLLKELKIRCHRIAAATTQPNKTSKQIHHHHQYCYYCMKYKVKNNIT